MSYHHLTIAERACIQQYKRNGLKQVEIAEQIKRSESCISRELARNASRDEGYNAIGAQRKYNKRRKNCVRKRILETNKKLFKKIQTGLNQYWSPEQIVNTLPHQYHISISTIYRAVKKKLIPVEYAEKLRRYGKNNRKNKTKSKGTYTDVRNYDQRPAHVLKRNRIGHWELDTVVLRDECACHLATMVERKSRGLLVRKILSKNAIDMADTIIAAMKPLPRRALKSLTVDRGAEFADWKRIETELNIKVYFADPGKPYQRGTNENTNGLLRQFFPRRTILPPISDVYVEQVQSLPHSRPRKVLRWRSPRSFLHFT